MLRLEDQHTIDFLTQHDLKKASLNRTETDFRKKVEDQKEISKTEKKEPTILIKEREILKEEDFPRRRAGEGKIRMKIRFDYRGVSKPGRFFFNKKNVEDDALEQRDQKMSLWQNLPLQGVSVVDLKVYDVYTVVEEDEDYEEEVAYAPLEVTVMADSLEDCVYLISREEFRRVEITEPSGINLNAREMEKMFIKFSEYFKRLYEDNR